MTKSILRLLAVHLLLHKPVLVLKLASGKLALNAMLSNIPYDRLVEGINTKNFIRTTRVEFLVLIVPRMELSANIRSLA